MKIPIQEAVAQVMFWTGLGSAPLSILLLVVAFRCRRRSRAFSWFGLAGIMITHFLWYGSYLGRALSTKVGSPAFVPWLLFLPFGLGGVAVCAVIWLVTCRNAPQPHSGDGGSAGS